MGNNTPLTEKATLQPGDYVLSDPCYVLSDDDYHDWLGQRWARFSDSPERADNPGPGYSIRGMEFTVVDTAYGDGCYADDRGRTYGVDAGCIACIPVELCHVQTDLGHTQTFRDEFECFGDVDGVIHFGDVEIDTDPEPEDDWWEDEDEEFDD